MFSLFHIKLHRRALLLVVAALLLAYAGLFQHLSTHHGGETDCVQCLAASHLGHALPSAASALSLSTTTEQPPVVAVAEFTSASIRYFSARAPPSFL
ncbi:MAG: hypothetical protein HZB57_00615 [Gammaproteobacteria bacterium]|nr:hypothetical protein [Gammaproteobacteria bacterium]